MKLNTMVELTRGEVGMLAVGVLHSFKLAHDLWVKGEADGWYDAKEKERVAVCLHETDKLYAKFRNLEKEMDA